MPSDMDTWLKNCEYVPPFMRDFHDQKLLFKWLDGIQQRTIEKCGTGVRKDGISWTQAHIYVIDIFLYVLAKRGWTLQRCRKDLAFRDIDKDMAAFDEELRASLQNCLTPLTDHSGDT